MLFIFLLIIGFIGGTLSSELDRYTRISKTTDGQPCLGGCSPITDECISNWKWVKKPCKLEKEPAPIYYTSQIMDRNSKVCLSNCGKFGYSYEWCVTTADKKWDYCSSYVRGEDPTTDQSYVKAFSAERKVCKSDCADKRNLGYWCNINLLIRRSCARQAISRIPMLPSDYKIGESKRHNCNAFLTNLIKESFRGNVTNFDSEFIPDDYLQEVADTIESAAKVAPEGGVFRDVSESGGAIRSYTMSNMFVANGTNILVPAVIRALVFNSTLRHNEPLIDVRIMIERNRRRRQTASDDDGYYNWRIIGYELGGSDNDYNFIRQSPNLYESWMQIQRAISKWCGDTGGSVDILVVVFYPDTHTNMPKGIGVSMSFYNPDGSKFVGCKDTVYWNK